MNYENEQHLRSEEEIIVRAERTMRELDEEELKKNPVIKIKDYSQFDIIIQGKKYRTVAGRITQFWDMAECEACKPLGSSITTDMTINGNRVVVKAKVVLGGKLEATGYASELIGDGMINKDSAIENTETSAIGRALGNMGIGLIGSGGVASAEEVQRAVSKQQTHLVQATDKQKNLIKKLAKEQGKPMPDDEWFDSLTMAMAKASIDKLLTKNDYSQPAPDLDLPIIEQEY